MPGIIWGTVGRANLYKEEVEALQRVVAIQPMACNDLAISYEKPGKTDKEIAALKKAIALRPRYAISHFNLAMAFMKS